MAEQQEDKSASEQIIEVLRDGRANPYLLRERTDVRKQRINRVLNRLQAQGRVNKVCKALYELDPSEHTEMPAHATIDPPTTAGDESDE